MENNYRIEYLPAARADVLGIFDYISPQNASAAERLLNVFGGEIAKIGFMPHMGKVVEDYELKAKGYRVLIVQKYYVFYLMKEAESLIEIHRILSSRQDYLQWLNASIT